MKTTNGKLRNVTSGILHTDVTDLYQFFENYLGEKGIMTHHLPSACKAIRPILEKTLNKEWFDNRWIQDKNWQNQEIDIPDLNEQNKKKFWELFNQYNEELWNEIKDKSIIIKT